MVLCLPVIKGGKESLDGGLDKTNSHVLGGAAWYGLYPFSGPSRSDDPAHSSMQFLIIAYSWEASHSLSTLRVLHPSSSSNKVCQEYVQRGGCKHSIKQTNKQYLPVFHKCIWEEACDFMWIWGFGPRSPIFYVMLLLCCRTPRETHPKTTMQ